MRLPFLTVDPGITVDVGIFIRWARLAHRGGVAEVYSTPGVNYGPLSVLLLAGAAWLDAWLPEVARAENRALIALIKLPSVLADVATAALIAWSLRRWLPARPRLAVVAALAYVFNPGVWYVSAYWGQQDSIYTLFLVASVVALASGRLPSAGMAYVLAMTVKTLGVSLAPLLVTWSLVRYGMRASLLGVAAAALVAIALCIPWLIAGRLHEVVLRAFLAQPAGGPRIVVSAYNGWYLLHLGRDNARPSTLPLDGLPISYQTAAIIVCVVFTCVVVAIAVHRNATPFVAAAALALGMFTLLTQMHERHMFPALPFLLLAAASHPLRPKGARRGLSALWRPEIGWWDYGILSFTFFFNLVTIASFMPSVVTNLIAAEDAVSLRLQVFRAVSLVVAALNLVVLGRLALAVATPETGTSRGKVQ